MCVYIYNSIYIILYNIILYNLPISIFFREMKEEIGLDERLFEKTWIHIDANVHSCQ